MRLRRIPGLPSLLEHIADHTKSMVGNNSSRKVVESEGSGGFILGEQGTDRWDAGVVGYRFGGGARDRARGRRDTEEGRGDSGLGANEVSRD